MLLVIYWPGALLLSLILEVYSSRLTVRDTYWSLGRKKNITLKFLRNQAKILANGPSR